MYKNAKKHFEGVKTVIDAEAYTGGILERAQDAAVSKDDEYIENVFGIPVISKNDPSQRKECGCVISRDIGMYDSCLFGCQYCYATQSFELAHRHHDEHNPQSPSLVGWYEPTIKSTSSVRHSNNHPTQSSLFDENG